MEIKPILWQQTISLRHQVLWPEKPPEFCHVEGDEDAAHFGAFIDGRLVCVASVFLSSHQARLRKFATEPDHQGQGIGSAMIAHILADLAERNVNHFWCDARESALGFYQRFGMQPEGERFYKGDIPYLKMTVDLGKTQG
ncbi:GNAT family N-acetyltransferase [Photobacterium sp. TY1-4]|uniref:GNAT family N-acetyltransferase n=1 Tax=Photobacterium sp. TY1-4 TaxID=2899122 RepID=UPI0021BEAFDE|nr:GNAT family N-acetyltransferase [Photobacterium sp. TY1-4]UXI03034.1 GNAT family N-acetyltransferase [Photobacterium sp. TY1-4]